MRKTSGLPALLLASAIIALLTGCPAGSSSDGAADGAPAAHDDGGAHGHSHAAAGPAGGHLLEIGDEEYHVEWVHGEDDDSVIEFIVRDEAAKEEVPIAAEELTLAFTTVDAAGKESTREVPVKAVGRTDEKPETAHFELTDRIAIQNILSGNKDVSTVLKLTINGVAYEREIEADAHGHGHSHSH